MRVTIFRGDGFPGFSRAEWNCRHPFGGETWDGVALCERFVLGSSSNRESFSPSAFQLGEKVPKADERAFHACVIRTRVPLSSGLCARDERAFQMCTRPPH